MVRILLEPIIRSIASCFPAMAYKLKIAFVLCNRCHVAMETGSVEKTSSRNINETRVGEILGERTFQVKWWFEEFRVSDDLEGIE